MTPTEIESLRTRAREEFEKGLWKESEATYSQLVGDGQSDENADMDTVRTMIDYSRLLYLKERKQECKELCIRIVDLLENSFPEEIELKIEAMLNLLDALSFYEGRDYSDRIIKEATDLARSRTNPEDRLLASVLCSAAAVALSHDDRERFSDAESLIDEAAEILALEPVTEGEEYANMLSARAICEQLKGNVEFAERCYQESLAALDNYPLSPVFSEACFGYATLRATDSKFAESIVFLEQQIKSREMKIGYDHPILKRAVSALALTYSACGELDEAEIQAQRYNKMVEMMGNPGPELRIDCLRILVDILQQQSRFSEAQALLTRAYDIADTIKDEGVNVRLLMDLARLKLDLGLFPEAVNMYERALSITRRLKGPEHFETAMCLGLLGNAYFAVRDYERAESTIAESIELCGKQEEFFGSLLSADNYRYLGLVRLQQKKFDDAEDALLKALSVLSSTGMESTLHAAETQKNLGELYDARGDSATAKFHFERALDLAKDILGPNNFEIADYLLYLADIFRREDDYTEAEKLYNQALSILEKTLGPGHPRTCTLLQRFGEIAIERSNFKDAEGYFEQALMRLEQTLGTSHPDVGYTCYCLGATYHWLKEFTRAERYYRRALDIKEQQLGQEHKDLATIIEPLIEILFHLHREAEANSFQRRLNQLTSYDSQKADN